LSGITHLTRKIRWMWLVTCMKENRGAYRVLVGRPEGKKPLGKPDRRWEKNIEINFKEMVWGRGLDWSSSG
jgi:hypothetical protein